MPELPEVQTVVEYLKKIPLSGKIIHSIHSPNEYEKVCNNSSLAEFRNFLQKKQIKGTPKNGVYFLTPCHRVPAVRNQEKPRTSNR